jgi:hypothetical protein
VTLPNPPPPEPQQIESSSGGGEQVEATNAAPADGTAECLSPYGYLLRSQASCIERFFNLQVPRSHQLKRQRALLAALELC